MKKNKSSDTKKSALGKYWKWICLGIISILFLSNYTRIFDRKIDMNGDNIYYYSLGNAINDGKGFTNVIGFDESPHTHFPPGYPYFIALLMKVGADSINAIKITNGVLLFLSIILLFFVLYELSKNKLITFTATLFAASQINILRFSTIMMSEILFVFFTLIVVLIILKWDTDKAFSSARKKWKDILIIILLTASLSYIYFIRTMGMSLILAVIIYYGIKSGKQIIVFLKTKRTEGNAIRKQRRTAILKYAAIFALTAMSLIVPKHIWDTRSKNLGVVQNDYADSFKKKLNGETMQTFSDWKERIASNVQTYTIQWMPDAIFSREKSTVDKATAGKWMKGVIILFLLLFGVYKLKKGGLLIFLYIGITMGVLLIYPEQYGGYRYMLAIIPFFIFLLIYGGYALCSLIISKNVKQEIQQVKYNKIISILVCLIFTLTAYSSYASAIKTNAKNAKSKEYSYSNTTPALVEYISAMQWAKDNLPDTARVSTRKPELFYIYSGERKSIMFPQYATPEEVMDFFTKNKIQYIIVDRWFRHGYVTIIPAIQKYNDKFKIIHQIKGLEEGAPNTYIIEFNPQWDMPETGR
ncbi:MAG: hypothetical protein LBT27_07105 [Prevotellaceae bacterium]|jgi:hypothetical protein|nr:hypothetical protein [Prevotellaceae bacterium]